MNYYEVLGVSETATDKEIKKSYKQLVKKYHPDVFEGNKELAEKKIKELNEAYEVLSDSSSRKQFDESLHQIQIDIDNLKNNFESYTQNSNQSSYSDTTSSYRKYEDFYKHDYYKRYSTNYYGISRDDLKRERINIHKKNQKYAEKDIFGASKSKLLIFAAISFLLLAIFLIILLALLRKFIEDDYIDTFNNETLNNQSTYQRDYLPYISLGMDFYYVRDLLGVPDFVETHKDGLYAYWGASYIVFDNTDLVIDWKNNGDFSSSTATGKELRALQRMYNSIIEE